MTVPMTMDLKGVVLVGGPSVGTRFRPLSMKMPKPLFPIAGQPMIYHHVAALAKVPGMKEILIIGFFEINIFERFITDAQTEFPGISIRYLREYQALGTGGGLFHFRDEILRGNPEKIFVMNADICSSFPLVNMLQFHQSQDATGTMLSIRVDRKDVHKYGCVVTEPETHKVLHFVEKPETFISDLINCGVYLFDKSIFDFTRQVIDKRRSVSMENLSMLDSVKPEEKVRLERDILSSLAQEKNLNTYVCNPKVDFWRQIKTGSSVIPANRLYLQHFSQTAPKRLSFHDKSGAARTNALADGPEIIQPVVIHPSASVHPGAKIGPNVMVGPRVTIGRGVRVKDSIILDAVEIQNDSCILNAVVGWNSKIGNWTRVEGAPMDATHLNATYKGLKIPTATILGNDVNVGDELVIRNCIVLPHKELDSSYQNEIIM